MFYLRGAALYVSIGGLLGGCTLGLTVPDMQEPTEVKAQEKFDEIDLAAQIQCEIHKGVQDALNAFTIKGQFGGTSVEWLRSWSAKVTMKLTVDDKSALSPGVTIGKPLANAVSFFTSGGNVTTPQSVSASFGLQASADATRVETIGYTYKFSDWVGTVEHPIRSNLGECPHRDNILILSDLKIEDFILNKVSVANDPGIVTSGKVTSGKADGKSPFSTFTDEITFVVIYGGNVTPVWKLVNVTASSNTPFFNATRTRTQDVTIALGAAGSAELDAVHQAQLIGQAVATAIQSQQH